MAVCKSVVYVVENDRETRQSLAALIRSRGLEVAAFPSAELFLSAFDPSLPGCVVTDLRMPGMCGDELQQRLIADGIRTPIIFLTGFADVPTTVRLMQQGAVLLMEKPYREDKLIGAIEEALQRDEQRQREATARREIAARLGMLSEGELQVMNLMLGGKPNKTIAMTLRVSMRTIDRRRRIVLDKMKTNSVPELAQLVAAVRRQDASLRANLANQPNAL